MPDLNPLEDITASGEEMLAFFELGRCLGDASDLSQVGEIVVRHLRRLVPSSLSVLYLHDQDAAELVSSYAAGEHSTAFSQLRIPLGQRLTGWVGAHKQSIRNSDPVLDFGDVARTAVPRLRSCLSTPLVVGQSLIGVLSLYSHGSEIFTDDHQRIVEVVAKHIAPVLQGITQGRRQGAAIDAIGRKGEQRETVSSITDLDCVIVITIAAQQGKDSVSVINAAEEPLSRCIKHHLRATDVFFRYRRDQFVIIHRRIDSNDGEVMARRLHRAIDEVRRELRLENALTAHITQASMPDSGGSLDELILAAKETADAELDRNPNHGSKSSGSIH